jgi:hypothetical protein
MLSMKRTTLLSLAFLAGCPVWAQKPPDPPACNSYIITKTLTENPGDLSTKQRFCIYTGKVFSGQAIFGPAFMAGVAQFRDDPPEWGQGTRGYLRRFGTRYAQGAAKTTGEFVTGTLLSEDPRYRPSPGSGFWKRLGRAATSLVVSQHLNGSRWPAISKAVGAGSSGAIGLAWYPDRLNTPGQVLTRTGSAYGGYFASAVFEEFQGEIFHYLGKMVGSDKGGPSLEVRK